MSQNRTKNLVKETAWFAMGNFGSKILSLLLVPLYTNILTTGEYGKVDILNTTISLAIPLLTLSLPEASFRYAMEKGIKRESVISDCLLVTFISPLILLALYPVFKLSLPVITDYFGYFFWIYAFNSVSSALSCYLKGIDKSKIFAIQGIIHTFAFAMSNIVFLVIIKIGVEGYLLSYLISHIASCAFMLVAGGVFKHISFRNIDMRLLKEMLWFSIPLIPAAVAWWIMTSIDRYMLLYMRGAEANGLYSVAHKLPTIISVITTLFINAWQITVVRNREDSDISEYSSKIFDMLFTVGMVLTFGMILVSKILGRLFFAKDFFEAWSMMPLLAVSTIFSTLSLFMGAQFTASKRSDLHLKSNIIAMVLNVILNYVLIKWLGINGAAYGTMISYFVVLIYRHIKIRELINFKVDVYRMYGVCCLLMAAAVSVALKFRFFIPLTAAFLIITILLYRKNVISIVTTLLRIVVSKRKKKDLKS